MPKGGTGAEPERCPNSSSEETKRHHGVLLRAIIRLVKKSDDTRLALLRAAEKLILRDGVAAVSLREIALEAGQRNHSAVLYHFGDKRGMLDAILERHSVPIQTGWLATLKHVEAWGPLDLSKLVSLLVRPTVDKVEDVDGGRAYLAVCAELVSSPAYPLSTMASSRGEGAVAIRERMRQHIPSDVPAALVELRMNRVNAIIYTGVTDYIRLGKTQGGLHAEAVVDDIVASVVAVITTRPIERSHGPIEGEESTVRTKAAPKSVPAPAKKKAAKA